MEWMNGGKLYNYDDLGGDEWEVNGGGWIRKERIHRVQNILRHVESVETNWFDPFQNYRSKTVKQKQQQTSTIDEIIILESQGQAYNV